MTIEPIEGTIENILFFSPDTGYTVFKFSLDDGQSLTVVGGFPPLSPGEANTKKPPCQYDFGKGVLSRSV